MTVLSKHEDELIDVLRRRRNVTRARRRIEQDLKTYFAEEAKLNDEVMLILATIADETALEEGGT